jgi:ParB-like chromosome segregation protein Spo0J
MDNGYDLSLQEEAVGETQKVPVRELLSSDSPRINGENEQHIHMLAQLDGPLPPILVHRGSLRVIDGMHRLRAAQLLGNEAIEVRFFDGTEDEAFIAGVKANTEHGLPLTLADRETAASRIIALYPERSDRWIASITGLAPGTISTVRHRSTDSNDLAKRRIGRDGRMRPLDGADGRRTAMKAIAERPDASLREIARIAGVSPGTVRDVREKMTHGEDPVSRKLSASSSRKQLPNDDGIREKRKAEALVSEVEDQRTLLLKLQRDPSLRFNEAGKRLLRWLDTQLHGPSETVHLVETIPPHCVYLIAAIAQCCADEWLQAARTLQQRCDDVE